MIHLFLPTSFDDALPEALADSAERITFYGQSARENFGGGRPGLFLPDPEDEALAAHIALCQRNGFRFSYLFNAACTGGTEYTAEGNQAFRRRLQQLQAWGVDEVTISVPSLARIIRDETPELAINAGLFARITDRVIAARWVEAGADKLTLFLNLNRNFTELRRIKTETGAKIELVATLTCLDGCIDSPHCAALLAHASRDTRHGGPVPTVFGCYRRKLTHPQEIIRSNWIRPEDLHHYEAAGVDVIKLTERTDSTETLIHKAGAYLTGHYEGNLLDLFTFHPRRTGILNHDGPRRRLDKTGLYAHARVQKLLGEMPTVFINNRDLDGFLEHYLAGNCAADGCMSCDHCTKYAGKIQITGGETAITALNELHSLLERGEL